MARIPIGTFPLLLRRFGRRYSMTWDPIGSFFIFLVVYLSIVTFTRLFKLPRLLDSIHFFSQTMRRFFSFLFLPRGHTNNFLQKFLPIDMSWQVIRSLVPVIVIKYLVIGSVIIDCVCCQGVDGFVERKAVEVIG